MARKSAVLIPVIIAAVAIGGLGLAFIPPDIKERNADFPKGTVRINDDVITVEVAQSVAEKQRWLTFRQDKLPIDTAMLMKYDKPDLYDIWMLNVNYNLDLIWFDQGGNAVYMKKDVPPCGHVLDQQGCTYKTTKPSMYILAGTAGFADAHKIDIGTKMNIISA
ncbi:DUF192 domain-containing protein [Nitrososphaera viennensis]|uniref:DUF192 domain-containing protein n=2 Tax=Nitrososphaera viennensis TaxID=1034015 RepID=A0A060HEV5_9ARCH|nr:DUF192 domain-containing protein [Nitrososphaera viennensis]AIC15204.1 putative protein of unknown function DUF192 [Nitrososphaera viennensis EN76]UVS70119.1 DUF192 domain-containing protein [Nitrososphaera viennensis]